MIAESPAWQPLASADLDVEQGPRLRMSAAGHCPASIAYAAHGFQETDPPDETARNRMAMGHFLEVLIVRGLEARGWETDHTVLSPGGQLEVTIDVAGESIPGHPDGICRHPEWTKGLWVVLECKSMAVGRAVEVERYGVAAVYPSYLVQAALYADRLYSMGIVAHPGRAVFGMMDREGRFLPPERVKIPRAVVPGIRDKFSYILDQRAMNLLPTPPMPQDSTECRNCGYHSLCWGVPKHYGRKDRPPIVKIGKDEDPRVVAAAHHWAGLKPEIDGLKDYLQQVSNAHDQATIEAGGVLAGPFVPRDVPVYDAKALEARVPGEILRECLAAKQPDSRAPFWIRKAAGWRGDDHNSEEGQES